MKGIYPDSAGTVHKGSLFSASQHVCTCPGMSPRTPWVRSKPTVSCQGAAGERQALQGLERQLRHVGVCGRVRPQQELDGRDVPEVLPLLPHACPGALGIRLQGPLTQALAPSTARPSACLNLCELSGKQEHAAPDVCRLPCCLPGTQCYYAMPQSTVLCVNKAVCSVHDVCAVQTWCCAHGLQTQEQFVAYRHPMHVSRQGGPERPPTGVVSLADAKGSVLNRPVGIQAVKESDETL